MLVFPVCSSPSCALRWMREASITAKGWIHRVQPPTIPIQNRRPTAAAEFERSAVFEYYLKCLQRWLGGWGHAVSPISPLGGARVSSPGAPSLPLSALSPLLHRTSYTPTTRTAVHGHCTWTQGTVHHPQTYFPALLSSESQKPRWARLPRRQRTRRRLFHDDGRCSLWPTT